MTVDGRGDAGKLLKILHVDPERNWGGGEAQVFGLLSHLAAKGHRNDLLTHPEGQLFAEVACLNVGRFPMVVRNDLDLRAVPGMRRRIEDGEYDIVHLHTKRAHALSLWLSRGKPRPKYIVTRRMDYAERDNWYTRCLYNRRVDGVVAISQNILDGLVEAGVDRRKIRLIHSGIDPSRFVTADTTGETRRDVVTAGCLAVLEERKGIEFLLEAAGHLHAQGVRLKWLIGGDGTLRQTLENQAHALGLGDSVTFLGFVAKPEEFLRRIDIFVMPSLFEGLGVAALEAMAAGKPVVASRVGGLAESILDGQTGLLVAPRDGRAIAAAVAKLAGDASMARRMGLQGRQRVLDRFTLSQMAAQNEAYYYELLGIGT
ncbi:MAG TPA: glycosyltransferase family 4 protein [Candidatus Binatia bacterium]|nr:glycosyltransferase family 4 protein [Candidatus Binatia bacterium]